jgi:hypothetical protein
VGDFAYTDDANLFRRSSGYSVSEGGLWESNPVTCHSDVDETSTRVLAMLQAGEGTAKRFREYLLGDFCRGCAASSSVRHIQATILDVPSADTSQAEEEEGVGRLLQADEQHQSMIEIVFDGASGRESFFDKDFKAFHTGFASHVRRVHAY